MEGLRTGNEEGTADWTLRGAGSSRNYAIGDPKLQTIRILENGGGKWVERGVFGKGEVIRPAGMPGVVVEVSEVYEVEMG